MIFQFWLSCGCGKIPDWRYIKTKISDNIQRFFVLPKNGLGTFFSCAYRFQVARDIPVISQRSVSSIARSTQFEIFRTAMRSSVVALEYVVFAFLFLIVFYWKIYKRFLIILHFQILCQIFHACFQFSKHVLHFQRLIILKLVCSA